MTARELIAALEDECRSDRRKVEDFLAALNDLLIEALERGQTVRLGKIGVFRIRLREGKPALNFYASDAMRARLKLSGVEPDREACPECMKRANKAARMRRWREKKNACYSEAQPKNLANRDHRVGGHPE